MAKSDMPSRICKGDKARFKDSLTAKKYRAFGLGPDDVFEVQMVVKISGSPCLYVPHPQHPGESTAVWARDCKLAWGQSSTERKKALGVLA